MKSEAEKSTLIYYIPNKKNSFRPFCACAKNISIFYWKHPSLILQIEFLQIDVYENV